MLGGVCGGLAKCYGKDAMLFRAGFVITSFFGGLTTLVYLYLMFTQPEETE
ncbi:MAG: PspC domain-containing protein [Kingella sp. (in: b-proteobacteria)]|jgi:pspC domain|nr:MAG: PspC domain-containing protein [Kingella sp. (in: b-proteobacteria)]